MATLHLVSEPTTVWLLAEVDAFAGLLLPTSYWWKKLVLKTKEANADLDELTVEKDTSGRGGNISAIKKNYILEGRCYDQIFTAAMPIIHN